MLELLIYNVASSKYWWQVRENKVNKNYVFVLQEIGKWSTEEDADPDEIQETWLEIVRENYDTLEEAGNEMIKSIISYHTPITGHGY